MRGHDEHCSFGGLRIGGYPVIQPGGDLLCSIAFAGTRKACQDNELHEALSAKRTAEF